MASSFPSLQVRKGSAVNEFLGRLIEKMAEVGTRSSMTSNTRLIISTVQVKVGSSTWPLNHCCSVYSCYTAITFHAVYTNEMHAQARSGRAKRATLLVIYTKSNAKKTAQHGSCIHTYIPVRSTVQLNGELNKTGN